jgi:hypothetical protein
LLGLRQVSEDHTFHLRPHAHRIPGLITTRDSYETQHTAAWVRAPSHESFV